MQVNAPDWGRFKPSFLKKEPSAKWMILEAGDVNSDGYDDIVVGANYLLSTTVPHHFRNK